MDFWLEDNSSQGCWLQQRHILIIQSFGATKQEKMVEICFPQQWQKAVKALIQSQFPLLQASLSKPVSSSKMVLQSALGIHTRLVPEHMQIPKCGDAPVLYLKWYSTACPPNPLVPHRWTQPTMDGNVEISFGCIHRCKLPDKEGYLEIIPTLQSCKD